MAVTRRGGNIIALIKPQFEAGKAEVDKGAGVIKDPEIHARVIRELQAFVSETDGLTWRGDTDSPITGPKGNKEFLAWIEKDKAIRSVGLIGNTGQAIKSGVVRKTAKLIEQSGRKVFLDPSVSKAAKGNGIVLADSGNLRACAIY